MQRPTFTLVYRPLSIVAAGPPRLCATRYRRTSSLRAASAPKTTASAESARALRARAIPRHLKRDLVIQAATTYDEMQKSIAILENQLHRAVAALEAKKVEIDNLNLLLSQERNRNDNHRNERDQAVAERAEVLAILSNVRAMVEKAEIPIAASATATAASLLIMTASSSPSAAANSPAQGSCLTRTQVEQFRPHSPFFGRSRPFFAGSAGPQWESLTVPVTQPASLAHCMAILKSPILSLRSNVPDYSREEWEAALRKAKQRAKPDQWPLINSNDF